MKTILTLVGLALTLPCLAFFDDFEGNTLNSHWSIDYGEGNTNRWDYNVADSWLNVTRLYQSDGRPGGVVGIFAGDTIYDDFEAGVKLSRDSGYSGVLFGIGDNPMYPEYGIGYGHSPGENPKICINIHGQMPVCFETGEPQTLILRINRSHRLVRFYVNDDLLFETNEAQHMRMSGIRLVFGGGQADPFGAPHVDWVSAVPEPATIASLSIGFLVLALGLRRRHK